jgi:hypothetical protein
LISQKEMVHIPMRAKILNFYAFCIFYSSGASYYKPLDSGRACWWSAQKSSKKLRFAACPYRAVEAGGASG